jgi:hypothetical protein
MTKRTRQTHSHSFKAKVALVAVESERTLAGPRRVIGPRLTGLPSRGSAGS